MSLTDHAAIESPDGAFRYWLSRKTDRSSRAWCIFVMLNPSTASATEDDPTIRRCRSFAEREDCGHLGVVNLWAARATKPADLYGIEDLRTAVNHRYVAQAIELADTLIVAWGANANEIMRRHRHAPRPAVESIAKRAGYTPLCFGTTKDGSPRHPLYVAGSTRLVPFKPAT